MGLKVGVLASGRGSNFKAVLDHIRFGVLKNVEVAVLVSNKSDANALKIADEYGVKAAVIVPKVPREKVSEFFDREAVKILEENGADLVILAGYMRVLTPYIIGKYRWKMMNIHPALLPSFPGLHAQRQALEHGVKVSGCTVHYVDEGVDTGPIILQCPVLIREDDTEEKLSDRIRVYEHRLYSKAIQLHADGRLRVEDRKVMIDYSDDWERRWNERQSSYLKYQAEMWRKEGKPLEELLG